MKGELINMTRAWDKEKIGVLDTNQTDGFPNTNQALYPLSYEKAWRARSFNWVLIQTVCRTPVTISSRSSVDRASARCSGGHGFDSQTFFFVSRSCHVDQFTFHKSRPYSYSRYCIGTSLQWRLIQGNIIKKRLRRSPIENRAISGFSGQKSVPD